MSHYGLLGDYRFGQPADDIRGSAIYGRDDEKLGKIDDFIFDHSTGDVSYAVVDTGGWLTTAKFLVPSGRLRPSEKHKNDFDSDLTKSQIEDFPPYKQKDFESQDRWQEYEDRYRSRWETGPVMHRAETDRNVTPTTEQLVGNQTSMEAPGDKSVSRSSVNDRIDQGALDAARSSSRIIPASSDSVVIERSAVGIGDRWDTFQARLRERRKEAVTSCKTCTVGSATSRDGFKKAV